MWGSRSVIAAALLLILGGVVCARSPEYRVMWVSRFEWPSSDQATAKANIDNIMQQLANNGFNAVLFQVRGQCDVHYPSPYEPWASTYGWTDPGWDPLAYAIKSAHERGLEFHAYINTHTLAQGTPPANTVPQHPYNLHGPNVPLEQSWVVRDQNGATATSDNYTWISPGIPEASWWVRRAVMHVVENYDVDGVHFDRIRTPGSQYSYDPITVARFNGDGNPDKLAWGDFMRSQITRDLRNIYGEIQWKKKKVKVSAAPFGIVYKDATTNYQGTGTQSYYEWYQDSWGWLSAHVVDFMVPQIYWEVGSSHPFEALLADWLNHRAGRFIVAGSTTNGGTKTASALLAEYNQTVSQNASGHCIFSVSTMGSYWSTFSSGPYATPAAIPDMPWKSAPTTGNIVGYVLDSYGQPVVDALVKRSGDAYNYLSAYDGFFAILEVPTSSPVTLTASKTGKGKATLGGITVAAGETTVVTLRLSLREGQVALNKPQYQFNEWVHVSLVDDDLRGSGHATVHVQSNTEPAGETLTLDETTTPGIFVGSVKVVGSGAVKPDGVVKVSVGDTLSVTYADADRGDGTPTTAVVTATIIAPPDIIIESRTPSGSLTPAPAYQEFITSGGAWANTTAKSLAPGLQAPGSRYTGSNSLGVYAVWRPTIISPGLYDVYITLANATRGPNNNSPGAGFVVQHAAGTTSGTFDLSKTNADLTDKWMLLAQDVLLLEGTQGSLTIINNNPNSSSTQRFCMDAVKFVYKGIATSPVGTIALDRAVYGPNAVVSVRVADSDIQGAGSVPVYFASTTESTSETVLLSEVGATGEFRGTIPLALGDAIAGDGVLQVHNQDVIVAAYLDEDHGTGGPAWVTAFASVDAQQPHVSDVALSDIAPRSAVVTFHTDEPCTGVVRFGAEGCGSTTQEILLSTPGQSFRATLSSLLPSTTYYVRIIVADSCGNVTEEDNGGKCYTFTTPSLPVGLEEHFDTGGVGWTANGLWHLAGGDDQCVSPASPPYCYHYARPETCTYNTLATNKGSLLSPEFIVPPLGELTFQSIEETEGTTSWDTRRVYVLTNGGTTRTPLTQLLGSGWSWYAVGPFDLSAYAGQPIALEFEFDSRDSYMNDYHGWAVDDVVVESADKFRVSDGSLAAEGNVGGPFVPASVDLLLWNKGTVPVEWATTRTVSWVSISPTSGTLAADEALTVTAFLNDEALALPEGFHEGVIGFFNVATGIVHTRSVSLVVKNPPAAPTNLRATDVTETAIEFQWTDNAENETTVVVERKSGDSFAPIAELPANSTQYRDEGLLPETCHTYRVYAMNGWGASPPSEELTTCTLRSVPPAPPTNLSAAAAGSSVVLAWTDNASNESGFEVEWAVGEGAFAPVATLAPNTTTWTHNSPVAGARNCYRVRAVNAAGPSDWSNIACVVTPLVETFASQPDGWTLVGVPSSAVTGDYDAQYEALRLHVTPSDTFRILGWQSPRLPLTGDPGTIYRFKAYVFRAGQLDMDDPRQVPNMRLRCSLRYAMNSIQEMFWHLAKEPSSDGDMAANIPSADPSNPTAYRVDLDPVDLPLINPSSLPGEGVQGMFEVYSLEPQENGSLELAEAVLMALPPPSEVKPLKTYRTSPSDAGDLKPSAALCLTLRGSPPLPTIDDSTTYGLVLDTTECWQGDVAIAAAEIHAGDDLTKRVRIEPGKQYRVRWHVVSPRETAFQSMLRLRLRTLRFAWSQKLEIGGAWAAGFLNNAIAQRALPGVGTENPDKRGDEIPGVLDGGWYTMYFNPPAVVPTSEPGPGVAQESRRDLKCGIDAIDTISQTPNGSVEGGLFILDEIAVEEFPMLAD